ncbi:polymorphic toxin-type HINT domain-containing protein, partial [Acinetobacter baumannii]|nr:polymorphic toxin-type HINT domain-containing protein [Acinetobacter baumannii]
DPQVGRFTSADPTIDGADNLQGYNRYSYVQNNPGTLLDPSGYSWFSKVTKEIGRAFTTVLDDWLGTCSKSRGDCNVTIGATYGANNQGVGSQNDGRTTVQPFIGFGGSNQYNQINLPAYEVGDIFGSTRGIDPERSRLIAEDEWWLERNLMLPAQGSDSDEDTTLRVIGAVNNELTAFNHSWTYGLYGSEPTSGGYIGQTAGMVAGLFTGSTEAAIARNVGKGAIWTATRARTSFGKLFSPCGCFDDDTPVLTKDGYKRIVEIKEGDLVLARHEETGEIAYKPVKQVFVIPNRRIYLLKTIDSLGEENIIEVSDDHPFWVVDKKWVDSIDLKEGDQLLDANNQVHKVVSITKTDRVETTYNLEVEGYHTYFAGDASIWVHNISPCKLSAPSNISKAFNTAYDDIKLGKGIPNLDANNVQKIYQGRENKAWAGAKEWYVPGSSGLGKNGAGRILEMPNGKMGYVVNHDYTNIRAFPSPWFPDGGIKPKGGIK